MPFYEYQCNNCGHALEAMQKVSDPPLKKCPHCGKPQLQKLMSAPVFRLKGGGWYETDFKSDQDSKRNLADRPEDSPKEEKKEGATAESKETPAADAKKGEKPAEKPAEKSVEKAASGDSGKKTAARASQGRPAAHKTNLRKAAKRPARPAIKRGRAKPARGR
jgi:putative FmdB family regulatory protein